MATTNASRGAVLQWRQSGEPFLPLSARPRSAWSASSNVAVSTAEMRVATPVGENYTVGPGLGVYAGMSALPAWLSGQALNTWFQIANTNGAGGAFLDEGFGGLAQVGTKWVSLANGGHTTWDNRVTSIDLSQDVPAWTVLKAASAATQNNVAYYTDGKPSGTHTYSSVFGLSATKAIRPGSRYTAPDQVPFDTVDVFDLTTNQWAGVVPDAPGTSGSGYANVTPSGYFPVAQDHNGDLWCVLHTNGNVAKYTVSTNTWSQPAMSAQVSPNVRYPWALDTVRNQLFGLTWGDGEGSGTGIRAVQLDYLAGTQRTITFSAGSVTSVNQFTADAPQYAGMTYDPVNDRFLFYSNGTAGRVYVVKPNAGTTWDMSILSASGALPATVAPLVKRFAYFPELRGVACLPSDNGNIYFMRLA